MNKEEVAKIVIPAFVGFFIGHVVGDLKRSAQIARASKSKKLKTTDPSAASTIQKWFDNAADPRTFDEVVDDWFYTNRFKQITNQK